MSYTIVAYETPYVESPEIVTVIGTIFDAKRVASTMANTNYEVYAKDSYDNTIYSHVDGMDDKPTATYECGYWDYAFGVQDSIDSFSTKNEAMSFCESNELEWSGKSGEWIDHSDSEWHMIVDGKPTYWVRKVEE